MKARKKTVDSTITPVLLDDPQTAARYQIGVSTLRRIAEDCNAVVRIGRLRRNDITILDAYFGISTSLTE